MSTKCTRCNVLRTLKSFINDKGRKLKTCDKCRERAKYYYNKYKCRHGREKDNCRECNGKNICRHDRIKHQCIECGGNQICKHDKRESTCKKCKGTQVCKHGGFKHNCKICGTAICKHGIQKHYCKKCLGTSICKHNTQIHQCKKCRDPIDVTISSMINASSARDKARNRYDAKNIIDENYLRKLIERQKNCVYCKTVLQYNKRNNTMGTIERKANGIGHTKRNSVLACLKCNKTRGRRYTHEQFKKMTMS